MPGLNSFILMENKMKRLACVAFAMLLASSVMAGQSFELPRAQDGSPLIGDNYGGASYSHIVTSGTENLIFSGRGLLFGIIASTVSANTSYTVFKDTGSASNAVIDSARILSSDTTTMFTLPMPLRVTNGLVIQYMGAVDAGITAGGDALLTVIYLDETP